MAVQKYKPHEYPRILEKTAEERHERIRETIAKSEESVAKAKKLVKVSRELVSEMKELKKGLM